MSAPHTATTTISSGERDSGAEALLGRFMLWVLLTLLALAAAYVFARGLGLITPGALLPPPFAEAPLLHALDNAGWQVRSIASGTAALVGLVSLGVLVRSGGPSTSRSQGRGNGLHVLEADERGLVVMESAGVEAVVRTAVRGTPGVFDADVDAKPSGRGVALSLRIAVLEDVDVRRAGTQARDRAVEAVERLVGLDVQGVRVRVEVLAPEELGRSLR